jgi:hypothetical protein
VKIASSPVYLDTSALAKLYLPESGSDEMEEALFGRRDVIGGSAERTGHRERARAFSPRRWIGDTNLPASPEL